MLRLFIWALIGILAGLGIGVYLGWNVLPTNYSESPLSDLAPTYRAEYTLMIADGYLLDGDAQSAVRRLSYLDVDNVPLYVQELTERYITNSRDIEEIRKLVALSEGLGRLTPPMEQFRQLSRTGESS